MTDTKLLRSALTANAVFSAGCGLLLILEPTRIAGLLGLPAHWLFQAVGIGLVVFASDLAHQITRSRVSTMRALLSSMGDLFWVLGSVLGLFLYGDVLSQSGVIVIAVVAALVMVFAVLQLVGIDRFHRAERPGVFRHCIAVHSNAPANAMWETIWDLGTIHRYSASLKSSEMDGGRAPDVGSVRNCADTGGRCWSEKVTAVEPGRSFDVRFLSEAPDFPYPFSEMIGGWRIVPLGEGCEVVVWWELVPNQRWLVPILLPVMTWSIDRDFVGVIRNMSENALGRSAGRNQMRGEASMVPRMC